MKQRGRPKKKDADPSRSMEELLAQAVDMFQIPYDDRDGARDTSLPSLNAVAEEMETTALRVRKLLITAEMYSTETSRRVQDLIRQGKSIEEVMAETRLGRASVYSYIPYKGLAFNLDETTVNADRHRVFRRRVKAVEELKEHIGLPDENEYLWRCVIAFEGYPFTTSGRGSRPGVRFTYTISRNTSASGQHYDGQKIGDYGNELKFSTKEKTVTRATVELAYRKLLEIQESEGYVAGPKKIGSIFGSSYIYPMMLKFGVIKPSAE